MELDQIPTPVALRSLLRRNATTVAAADGDCAVCGMTNSAWPRFRLRACGHCAHTRCLKRWWTAVNDERGRWVPVCPLCRSGDLPLEEEQDDDESDDDEALYVFVRSLLSNVRDDRTVFLFL